MAKKLQPIAPHVLRETQVQQQSSINDCF